jgi:hypothetical protein
MFEGTRTVDWVVLAVDLLILVLIFYEIVWGGEVLPRRRLKKRIARIAEFTHRGQVLQTSAPRTAANNDVIAQWAGAVQSWVQDTNGFLKSCSPIAPAKFVDDSNSPAMSYPGLSPQIFVLYRRLTHRLANLQAIIQFPTVYL